VQIPIALSPLGCQTPPHSSQQFFGTDHILRPQPNLFGPVVIDKLEDLMRKSSSSFSSIDRNKNIFRHSKRMPIPLMPQKAPS
jgi:hypothetical protein